MYNLKRIPLLLTKLRRIGEDLGILIPRFDQIDAEQKWRAEFHQSFSYDGAAFFLGLLTIMLGVHKVIKDGNFSIGLGVYLLLSLLQNFLMLGLVLWRRQLYYKHREAILTANTLSILFLSRVLVYYFYAMCTPAFLSLYPVEPLPAGNLKAWIQLTLLPAMAFRFLVTFIVPTNTARLTALVTFVLVSFYSVQRCQLELATIPGQGQRYQDLLIAFENFSFQYVPLLPILPLAKPIATSVLSEYQACIASKNLIQITVGYFLPLTIVFVEESVSRNAYLETNEDIEFTFNFSHAGLIIRHLLLFPLQTALAFQCIVPIVQWKF